MDSICLQLLPNNWSRKGENQQETHAKVACLTKSLSQSLSFKQQAGFTKIYFKFFESQPRHRKKTLWTYNILTNLSRRKQNNFLINKSKFKRK